MNYSGKYFLVGMMGSGKSTQAHELGRWLNLQVIDLDDCIEQRTGKTIAEIFTSEGEPVFRRIEAQLLDEWIASDEHFVMATGGGTPCFHSGIDKMKAAGKVIFLDVPIDELMARLERQNSHRPLIHQSGGAQLQARLEHLREQRLPAYTCADITISGDFNNPNLWQKVFEKA